MTAANGAETDAILSLLERMRAAWARGDATAYADCFTADSDYVTYNGIHLRGRKENAELHAPLFRGVLKGTRLWFHVESFAFLAADVALVHTAGASARQRPPDSGPTKSVQTLVVLRQGGQWRIRSFQNTRVGRVSAWVTRRMAARRPAV